MPNKDMRVHTRLRETRSARGVSAADLARRVGVSRQTIYAIEEGAFVPNTVVSLHLARALHVAVEELFSVEQEQVNAPITAEFLGSDRPDEGSLVRVCRVNERVVALPIPSAPSFLPTVDGVVASTRGRSASINSPGSLPDEGKRLLLAGCDPALSLLTDLLRSSGVEIVAVPCSSRRALEWLKRKKIHAAGSHLLDRATGDYNLPIIRRLLPTSALRIVTFATWEQGLVVQHGNPKSIRSLADLTQKRVRLMNREKGSGSRDLLDTGLRQLGIAREQVRGYNSTAHGHLAAASAVAARAADCCIAPRSAARCFGLDFIPLAVERFDLSFFRSSLELPAAKALLDLLNRSQLRKKLECIAGYDTAHTGEVLI